MGRNGLMRLICIPYRCNIMENTYYIQIFEKFLQNQASRDEVEILLRWLKDKKDFREWMDREWDVTSADIDLTLQQKLFRQIKEEVDLKTKAASPVKDNKLRNLFLFTLRIASVIILLLTTGFSVYYYTKKQMAMPDMIVSVEKGQKANVVLPDGSKVAVNSDSRLTYGSRFNEKERVIMLEGEAYFEIAPDEKRPFIIETNELKVRALGTSFNVKSYEEENNASAVLMTGRVEVASGRDCLILNPNERILFDKHTGSMTKSIVEDADAFVNWRYNKLTFNGETFESIVYTLERYYNIRIIFETESLKKYRFTGTTANTSLESILQIFSLTSPLSYEVKDSTIILRENISQKAYYEKALK